jgi:tetratricopeptide (TPR) repeat protein
MNLPGSKLVLLLVLLLVAPQGMAADSETLKKRKVSRTAGLSQDAYKKMQEVQQLMEEDKVAQAEAKLKAMQAGKLSDYERAQSWFLMGYVHFQREDFTAAQKAYEEVLKNDDLPLGMQTNVLRTLAQLSMVNGDFKGALDYLHRLLDISEQPQADHYALKAQVHYQLQQYDQSMTALNKAEALQAKRGEPPRENWLLLKNAILYQREDYDGMLAVVQQLVRLYPKDRYLLNMAGIYAEKGDSKKQLSLLEPLYDRGSLPSESHKINLASLYLLNEIPYKAAALLESEMKAGHVKPTEQHLEMLAQAWLMAANIDKAVKPLERVAKMSDDGEAYLTLARTYMSLNRWPEAEDSVSRALAKGGLRDEAGAHMLLGMTRFNQHKLREARSSFARAGESPDSEKLAKQWMEYLEREEEKLELAEQAAEYM